MTERDRALGLSGALRVLVKAVQRLANGEVDFQILQSLTHDSRIMRLEHVVATPMDLLAWLHAQTAQKSAQDQAAFYLANREKSLELACIGPAM